MPRNKGGRPTSIEAAARDTKDLAKKLRQQLNVGLFYLAEDFAANAQRAIKLAQEGDKDMIKFLLKYPLELHELLGEVDTGVFAKMREKWTYERVKSGTGEEAEAPRPSIPAEYNVIP